MNRIPRNVGLILLLFALLLPVLVREAEAQDFMDFRVGMGGGVYASDTATAGLFSSQFGFAFTYGIEVDTSYDGYYTYYGMTHDPEAPVWSWGFDFELNVTGEGDLAIGFEPFFAYVLVLDTSGGDFWPAFAAGLRTGLLIITDLTTGESQYLPLLPEVSFRMFFADITVYFEIPIGIALRLGGSLAGSNVVFVFTPRIGISMHM